jgi:hypothetical protein
VLLAGCAVVPAGGLGHAGRLAVRVGATRHLQADGLPPFTRVAIKLVGERLVGTPVVLVQASDLAALPTVFEHLPAGRLHVVLNAFDAADQVVAWGVADAEVGSQGTAGVALGLRSVAGGYEAVYHCPALCGPPPAPLPEASLAVAFQDFAGDLVGNLGFGADRSPDGHFGLDLDLPTAAPIQALTLEQYRNGQAKPLVAWSTATGAAKPTEQFLGVLNRGTRIQNGPVAEFGRFNPGRYHWDLYATSGGAAFKHGDRLRLDLSVAGHAAYTSPDLTAP